MADRDTTSEYQPAPPCYRNAGKTNQLLGAPNNIITVVNRPSQMQCASATRGIDGVGNRINSAGQIIGLTENLEQKAISNSINPRGK